MSVLRQELGALLTSFCLFLPFRVLGSGTRLPPQGLRTQGALRSAPDAQEWMKTFVQPSEASPVFFRAADRRVTSRRQLKAPK